MSKKLLVLMAMGLFAAMLATAAAGFAADRERTAASAQAAASVQQTSFAILKLKLRRRMPVNYGVKLR